MIFIIITVSYYFIRMALNLVPTITTFLTSIEICYCALSMKFGYMETVAN